MTLVCPSKLDDINTVMFVNQLRNHEDEPALIIDFTQVSFALPFATLLLAESLRQLVRYRASKNLATVAYASVTDREPAGLAYLKHAGFFQFAGIEVGKPSSSFNSNFTPIMVLTRENLLANIKDVGIQGEVNRESYRIASMLVVPWSPECKILAQCIKEIVRNTFEHANINSCTILAEKWNTGWAAGYVEIAIIDRGRGVFESLRDAYKVESAEHAIRLALQPGVTRHNTARSAEARRNSGLGLYIVSKVGVRYGSFAICSSGKMLTLSPKKEVVRDVAFNGTAVKLRINLQYVGSFSNFEAHIEALGMRSDSSES